MMDSSSIRRIGFTKLSSGPENDKALNIVFVHGLMGHPQNTWQSTVAKPSSSMIKSLFRSTSKVTTEAPSSIFWPRDLLAADLPGSAIVWTYGYDADAVQGIFTSKNQNSIRQHGNDFKVKIERDLRGPVVFIAHSLGGIIVKYTLWQSKICQSNTKLVIFLGTPHRGSDSGTYGSIAANLAAFALQDMNHRLVRSLEVDSETLNIINGEFIKVITKERISVHSFQEGKPISGIKGLHTKIVPDFSSVLDIDDQLETRETINQDHRQMAKCSSRMDEQYNAILGVLRPYVSGTSLRPVLSAASENASLMKSTSLAKSVSLANSSSLVKPEYMVPSQNRSFTGRSVQVEELVNRLVVSKTCKEIAICGLGGIGKTQIALEFCHHVKKLYPQYSIFWISALSRAQFEKNYTELANVCGLTIPKKQELLYTVKRHLNSKSSGPWIMVIDNADDRNVLYDELTGICQYLPACDGDADGIKLYTTRDVSIGRSLAGFSILEVQELDSLEAENLLKKCLGHGYLSTDRAIIEQLLEELTSLPLAIVQASAFIIKHQISIWKYLALMKQTDENKIKLLSEDFHDNTQPSRSNNAIATTWLISFETIKEAEPSALELFYFLTFVENKDIPQAMLPAKSELALVKAIGVLRNYSFLSKQGDADLFSMHRLVHQIGRSWIQKFVIPKESPESVYIQHFLDIFPSEEIENRNKWRQYMPHALFLIESTVDKPSDIRAALCLAVGRCLAVDGRLSAALRFLETCYIWRLDNLDEQDLTLLESRKELAIAYRWHGLEKQAIPMLEQVVKQESDILQADNLSRISSIYELGVAYLWAARYAEALARLGTVVTKRRTLLGDEHPDVLTAEHSYVLALRSSGRTEQAAAVLQRNVRLDPKSGPDAASSYTSYASARVPVQSSSAAAPNLTKAGNAAYKLSEEQQARLGEMTFDEQVKVNKHVRESIALVGWISTIEMAITENSRHQGPSQVLSMEDQLVYSVHGISTKWVWTEDGGSSTPFDKIINNFEAARELTPRLVMTTASQIGVKADIGKVKNHIRVAKGLIATLPKDPPKLPTERLPEHTAKINEATRVLRRLISVTRRRIITHFEATVLRNSEENILAVSGYKAGVVDRTNKNLDSEVRKLVVSQVSLGNVLLRRYTKLLSTTISRYQRSTDSASSPLANKPFQQTIWNESMISSPVIILEGMLAIQKVGMTEASRPSNENEETVAVCEQRLADAYFHDGQIDEGVARMRKVIATLRLLPVKHQSSLNAAEESLLRMLAVK